MCWRGLITRLAVPSISHTGNSSHSFPRRQGALKLRGCREARVRVRVRYPSVVRVKRAKVLGGEDRNLVENSRKEQKRGRTGSLLWVQFSQQPVC